MYVRKNNENRVVVVVGHLYSQLFLVNAYVNVNVCMYAKIMKIELLLLLVICIHSCFLSMRF